MCSGEEMPSVENMAAAAVPRSVAAGRDWSEEDDDG